MKNMSTSIGNRNTKRGPKNWRKATNTNKWKMRCIQRGMLRTRRSIHTRKLKRRKSIHTRRLRTRRSIRSRKRTSKMILSWPATND